jgi:SAM-dependent methyltransferase
MKNSQDYYDELSESYDSETLKRKNYLNTIDDYIINTCDDKVVNNYMDIGSGDGRRSLKIAESIGVRTQIILVDNSEKMTEKVKKNKKISIFNTPFNDLNINVEFDLITCLWNVIGHFSSYESRLDFFKKIDSMLSPNGVFIFDVNNRYNIEEYGKLNVANNIRLDMFNEENRGYFTLGKAPNQTEVYIHTPFDINDYLKPTNLLIDDTKYIHYLTGLEANTFFEGQLLYKIRKS